MDWDDASGLIGSMSAVSGSRLGSMGSNETGEDGDVMDCFWAQGRQWGSDWVMILVGLSADLACDGDRGEGLKGCQGVGLMK
ncbi:hypothetical protein M0R45_035476 [Rubus argutus]|uniref:Uncharacterized protein n=1 Tax=Rubus argutus TaxID=59490 RepID=A0AAW1VUT1_RUBAR